MRKKSFTPRGMGPPPTPPKSDFRNSLFFGIALVFAALLVAGAYISYVGLDEWREKREQRETALNQKKSLSDTEPSPEPILSVPGEPAASPESMYEDFLSSQRITFEQGPSVSVGPAALKISTFWDSSRRTPHFWLEVRTASLPDTTVQGIRGTLAIDHVWSKKGADVYHRTSRFERESFQQLSYSERHLPYHHLQARRTVYLKPGTSETEVRRVEGKLTLSFPAKLETLTFDTGKPGEEQVVGDVRVSLVNARENQVLLTYDGPSDRYLGVLGYNEEGDPLELSFQSRPTGPNGKTARLKHVFWGNVRMVEVLVAPRTVQREYPFVIKKPS